MTTLLMKSVDMWPEYLKSKGFGDENYSEKHTIQPYSIQFFLYHIHHHSMSAHSNNVLYFVTLDALFSCICVR